MTGSRRIGARIGMALAIAQASVAGASAQTRRFDVPALPAAQGIRTFAAQAGRQILAPDRLVRGRRTAAVRGNLRVDQGLARLLRGSGLVVRSDDGQVVVLGEAMVVRLPSQPVAPIKPDPDIVVTGIRFGLSEAAIEKRATLGIVEAVQGRELANYPHGNVADLLQRVSSVTVARDAGEGRQISVRGLGPDYTRVRVNGMELLSATGGTDSSGGVNRGRAIDFNVLPGDLFASVVVRKISDAADEEGALGASLELKTPRPLDGGAPHLLATAQASASDSAGAFDPSATLAAKVIDRSGRLGAALALTYERRRLDEEGHGTGGWQGGTAQGGFSGASPFLLARDPEVFSPRFPRYGRLSHDQRRIGATASIQYRPSSEFDVTLDLLHASQAVTRRENWLEVLSFARGVAQGGRPDMVVRSGVVNAHGDLVQGIFDGVDVQTEARLDRYRASTQQAVLGGEWRSGGLMLRALAGVTHATYRNPTQINVILNREDSDGYSYDYRGNTDLPSIDYGFDVGDAGAFAFTGPRAEIRLNRHSTTNDEVLARLSATRDIGGGWSVEMGASYKRFDFRSDARTLNLDATSSGLPSVEGLAGLTTMVEGFGDGLGIAGRAPTRWVTPDVERFAGYLGFTSGTGDFALSRTALSSTRGVNFAVGERVFAQYARLAFDRPSGLPLRGAIGIRRVATAQRSVGFASVDGAIRPAAVAHRYDDWLPSASLVVDLDADTQLRLAAAQVMARPGLTNLSAGMTVDTVARTISAGNPRLAPIRADALDAELQWRFAGQGLFSVGLFWKRVRTFVQFVSERQVLAGSEVAYLVRRPINTPGGTLAGLEAAIQFPFKGLAAPFDRFGIAANFTRAGSRIAYRQAGQQIVQQDLLGLSPTAWNALLYYEHRGASVRMTVSHRDRYLTAVPGAVSGNDVDGVRAITTMDAFASFAIAPRAYLTLEALNLTDARNIQFNDSVRDSIYVATRTGRRFGMGIRYTY